MSRAQLYRTITRLLELEVDAINDAELIHYVYACRETLAWARVEINPRPELAAIRERPARGRPTEWTPDRIREAMLVVEREGTVRDAAAALNVSGDTLYAQLRDRADPAWFERAMRRAKQIRAQRMRDAKNKPERVVNTEV